MPSGNFVKATVLAALKARRFPYVGLIGSGTKRARFASTLRQIGLAGEDIDRLICPIGLTEIHDKAPASIAASIAAQLLIRREAAAVTVATVPGRVSAEGQIFRCFLAWLFLGIRIRSRVAAHAALDAARDRITGRSRALHTGTHPTLHVDTCACRAGAPFSGGAALGPGPDTGAGAHAHADTLRQRAKRYAGKEKGRD